MIAQNSFDASSSNFKVRLIVVAFLASIPICLWANWDKYGGAERNRTAGLLIANEALSQLSYSPKPEARVF